jgi:very-short-patch-repair endonuclease
MNDFVRHLRRNQTDAEQRLWHHLRGRRLQNHKFRRQHPIAKYIADFVCLEKMLVVELDGGQHVTRSEYDNLRTAAIAKVGYRVIRYWNDDVLLRTTEVLEDILRHLNLSTIASNQEPS